MTSQLSGLSSFSFQDSHSVRTVNINNNVWFLANDICHILGYSNPRKAIADHCKLKGVTKRDTPTNSGIQLMTYIDEPNLYRLTTKSKMPNAEKFEEWVFEIVLPQIRKTGSYAMLAGERITAKQLHDLKYIIDHISSAYHYKNAFTQAAWKMLRDTVRVDSIKNVNRNQIASLKPCLEKLFKVSERYITLRQKAESDLIKQVFRSNGDESAILKAVEQQHKQLLSTIHDNYHARLSKFEQNLLNELN